MLGSVCKEQGTLTASLLERPAPRCNASPGRSHQSLTPLSSLMFAEAAQSVGLPPGVLNIVLEAEVGGARLLTTHPLAVAQRVSSGAVHVNGALSSTFVPFGGIKESGLGDERGIEGLRLYQQLKILSVTA
jgi:acyl-CoA reductase-like NAD-dependent aldehyde dehydrogenase